MKRQAGFTLIEIMITVALIAILTAIAIPNYSKYVLSTRLADAYTGLAEVQPRAEQHWSNKRSYEGMGEVKGLLPVSNNFTFTVESADATSYLIKATGKDMVSGFAFTIDQNGKRATTAAPDGWTKKDTCWVRDKQGTCSA